MSDVSLVDGNLYSSAATYNQLRDELDYCAHTALSEIFKQFNSTTSQARLPVEIWLHIWEQLPLVDRVTVSHVCYHWRATTLCYPILWCSLDVFSTLHDDQCDCEKCSLEDPIEVGESNVALLGLLLPRSLDLPLKLSVRIAGANVAFCQGVSTVLGAAYTRVVDLRIVQEYESGISCFLAQFNGFPALRRLVLLNQRASRITAFLNER
ncbi:hypothetical protein EXIGLDRAFT_784221 [Exidia glandulosa HHB12029]|uniref:F-box domain-containing protein n=1 Tax=Exidia glandulosa HHB12029 TaxID=1314781 RepID=A0A166MLE2_EXIGL|nr:hypothetical protein EXIGLDRAFT_784221 [Exidia glandulosa HHB12029]